MLNTKIIPFVAIGKKQVIQNGLLAFLLSLLVSSQAWSAERAYYSTGAGVTVPMGSPSVTLATSTEALGQQLTATVQVPLVSLGSATTVRVRLPLGGVAPAGYRAGVLVATANQSVLALQALGTITLRTYLGTTLQDGPVQVSATVAQLALLAGKDQPVQLEITSQKDFNQVEVEFTSAVTLNVLSLLTTVTTKILYAYGVGQDYPKPVTGFLSQFGTAALGQYSTVSSTGLVCANSSVINPERAVDGDLTNYASLSALAAIGDCPGNLQVQLAGQVPATGYRAGFVVGNADLLDASVLSSLRLHTFLGGQAQEVAAGNSLLTLDALADGKYFLSFPATKAFDAVSIERTQVLGLLNNLRIYYGFGLENTAFASSAAVISYPLSQGHFSTNQGGVLCVACPNAVVTPTDGTPAYIQLSKGVGVGTSKQVQFELNGAGLAGNTAGIVLGQRTFDLANLDALKNVTLSTYDAAGNVLETASSSAILALAVLPDGRQEVTFRTTRNFAQVGLTANSTLAAATDLSVYSAFADDRGTLRITAPPTPLPVVLTSFGVSRAAGTTAATVAWATASEQHSASFVVERATDPQAGFQVVGRVAAAGTSAATHQYSLRDAAAPMGTTLYYRLRQLDTDGREQLSPVAVLAAAPSALADGFSLYPNPAAAGTVSLSLSLSLGGAVGAGTTVAIYSSVGRLLSQQALGQRSEEVAAVSTAGLPAGIYQVVLRDATGQRLGTKHLVINQ